MLMEALLTLFVAERRLGREFSLAELKDGLAAKLLKEIDFDEALNVSLTYLPNGYSLWYAPG